MITKQTAQIGIIGLGVMGRNLLLNMADHGFCVAGYDKDVSKVTSLQQESQSQNAIYSTADMSDFLDLLQKPRAILLLVPAGAAVDSIINELLPYLQANDLIIDAGNSHYTDTDLRTKSLRDQGIAFLGVGVSGGEEGARHGPSIMPGGEEKAYARVQPIFEAIAALAHNQPCVAYLGLASSGHYVKMVHNGIEYGIMQLIAESYDVMKRGLGLTNRQLHDVYDQWNKGSLNGYLIEITANIFNKMDEGNFIIDEIIAVAKQNGTGMWTSQDSMQLQVPTPTIDVAVSMRDLSVLTQQREQANMLYHTQINPININTDQLQDALYIAMITVYAQGMTLLKVASDTYGYQLNIAIIAQIWRGGCIIRAEILEDIAAAYRFNPDLVNPLLDPNLAKKIATKQANLRQVISQVSLSGIPIPVLMASMSYLEAYQNTWSPANLIQAQRDYFGAHTYQRKGMDGIFHTHWQIK